MYDWQLWCTVNHYRVVPGALSAGEQVADPDSETGLREVQPAEAFFFRRSQVVAPQKIGKGPWSATIIAVEAAGPAVFDGWSEPGEVYACADHGCPCGWRRAYMAGEPRGKAWPTPLIQLTATSEDQTRNVYVPLLSMARGERLRALMEPREGFIRVRDGGRIDMVTSKATSRVGNPVTFPLQDESGLYVHSNGMIATAETQRRGAAGMGARSMETTNAWNPAQDSYAQRTAAAAEQVDDIFRYHREAPAALNYALKGERREIHKHVYAGTPHVSLTVIEAEASELALRDLPQAERFYGNRIRAGASSAVDPELWAACQVAPVDVPDGSLVTVGIDGARFDDALAVVATRVTTGFQWPLAIVERPPNAGDGYEHDFDAVDGPLQDAFDRLDVWRVLIDPGSKTGDISAWMQVWQGRWGKRRVADFYMQRTRVTAFAVRRWLTGIGSEELTHPGDPVFSRHVLNAHRHEVNAVDEDGLKMFVLAKERAGSPDKMDGAAAAVLSWEARGHAIAEGVEEFAAPKSSLTRARGTVRSY